MKEVEKFMIYIFVSDIHGNVENLEEVIEIFNKENADKLVILGDTASYMDDSINEKLAEILNQLKDKVEVIRGNCDTISFEEKLQFEMLDMDNLYVNGKIVTVTHGQYYNCYELPSNCGEIFIQGHTHIPMLQKINGKILANPGSVTKPRGADLRCYVIINRERIALKTLEGKLVKEICFEISSLL